MPAFGLRLALPLLVLPLLLSACGGGGPVRRINPPVAAVQQLVVQPDGSWALTIRINNFSTVPMHFTRVTGSLEVGASAAAGIDASLDLEIPGQAADVFPLTVRPDAAAVRALAVAEEQRREVHYLLHGRIACSDPDDSFEFEFDSRLAPVPGRSGQFR